MGSQSYGIDTEMVNRVAGEIADVIAQGIEVCLVIGGGNIFRGVSARRLVWNGPLAIIWACLPQ